MDTDKMAEIGSVPYPAIPARRKSGNETFITEDGPVATLSDFWAWAYSDLVGNTERGRLGEYIVALALGCEGGISESFGKYDLRTQSGISVEVKSSAYLQSWNQEKLSEISFGIQPTLGWDSITNVYEQERKRQADVYVFCLHGHKEQGSLNPLDITQWEFWVLATTVLNQAVDEQKTISLPQLKRLGAIACTYSGLCEVVAQAVNCTMEQHAPALLGVHDHSTPEEKICLFRSLFQGREDVFARRWYSEKTGMSGYAPVCANEWREGVCDKRRYKCAQCPHRELVPITDAHIYRHLSGKDALGRDVVGLYPMRTNETCNLLAVDFDEASWQEDIAAVRGVCEEHQIFAAVERSRSGNGAHLWLFFATAVPCALARRLGSGLLTLAMERSGTLKFSSYDRMFPSQDTLPAGGFGNLISLPLQGRARREGNSVFIDQELRPWPDQWAFLDTVRPLTAEEAQAKAAELCQDGELGLLVQPEEEERDKPWERKSRKPLMPMDVVGKLTITRANLLYLEKSALSGRALNRIRRLASFQNPEFYKAQAMRFPTHGKPRVICTAEETEDFLALPRGCEPKLVALLDEAGVSYELEDKTQPGRAVKVCFNGVLRPEQQPAAEALAAHRNGVLSATTAFGKTVIAAWLIGERRTNTLILVHTQALLNQWKTALEQFLNIDEALPPQPKGRGRKKERTLIGQLGGGKNNLSGFVDIAILQSLIHGDEVAELVKDYGMVIVDECHHVSAVSFEKVLKEAHARYVYGLTATPNRQDGHQPIIHMQCGPIRYRVSAKEQAGKRDFAHTILPRFTAFAKPLTTEKKWTITETYTALAGHELRNQQIAQDVRHALALGRTPLVLTERYAHAQALATLVEKDCAHTVLLSGRGTAKEKRELLLALSALPAGEPLVVVATGRYVGEGFDLPRLDTLFLAMPVAWKGTLAQYAGRLHRSYTGKEEVIIYDYVDARIPVLERMYHKRLVGYAGLGYTVKSAPDEPEQRENLILNQSNYLEPFIADILTAKQEVILVSPYLHPKKVAEFLCLLDVPVGRGVKVKIITGSQEGFKPETWKKMSAAIRLFRQAGIPVDCRQQAYQRFAVIDQKTAWYGSVNFLGYDQGEAGVMRLQSNDIVQALLDTLR